MQIMRIQAWAPGHATLVFSVPSQESDPVLKGSLGVGLNFKSGVLTTLEPSSETIVKWNSQQIDGKVTSTALTKFQETTQLYGNFEINHYSELKIGHGLSTSGAGALGTVLCLNEYYPSSKLQVNDLYKIAHYADVVNHTGLGSVMGQIKGGIEIRTKIGGPGVGQTINMHDDSMVIILMMGKIQTSDVLTSDTQMQLVNKAGQSIVDKIISQQNEINLETIIRYGLDFSQKCGLMTDRVREKIDALTEMGEDIVSMAMIGETIIVLPKNPNQVLEYAQRHRIDTVVTKISGDLPKVIRLDS